MGVLTFNELSIPGAFVITPFYTEDNRGSFLKPFLREELGAHGIPFCCDEEFFSHSDKNVIRGMHFQTYHPQAKLVQILVGKVYDVIVDLREESPSFGQWTGVYLSAKNRLCLFIPRGCAHGFLGLEEDNLMSYKCDGLYDKATDTGILYCDPEIGIEWPINHLSSAIVGKRDQTQMSFSEFRNNCHFIY